jgi:hypothetical protein
MRVKSTTFDEALLDFAARVFMFTYDTQENLHFTNDTSIEMDIIAC